MSDASDNIPQYSVSEISGAVKRVLEGAFARVRVRGEITEFKRYPSGHMYFSLKDEGGKIAGVIWRGVASRLALVPENGVEVIATGRVSSYGERSNYQLIVDRLDYAGEGALLARIERLRQKLAQEGLFDAQRKRPWPRIPAVVGVITSPQGAVLHDIRTTIARRFPRHILLWPVAVQGEGAAAQIAAAISGFSALGPGSAIPRPDVLIVARGGGSLEDLMAFNDEAVVRAAAASTIPLISAVGHETDTTLIDFVSDRRAPTPTAAAELAVPMRADLVADMEHRSARLVRGLTHQLQTLRVRFTQSATKLPDLPSLLGQARMRLDDRAHRLGLALPHLLERQRTRFKAMGLDGALQQALHHYQARFGRVHLSAAMVSSGLRERRAHLAGLAAHLESVSVHSVLRRGYVMVSEPSGSPVQKASQVRKGARMVLTFADGQRTVKAEGRSDTPQGDLGL